MKFERRLSKTDVFMSKELKVVWQKIDNDKNCERRCNTTGKETSGSRKKRVQAGGRQT